ncbi:MAG: tRNA 2-thiocytidine(32) synthetase TtcA [Clostridia bacterium]|nr:tRNA 2-thiocytidine(32) synthetase TtcA [Clostridia bacterium]MBO7288428.1 tRNA 2-thiocytidine(32) synthetase TtcA [Clostridia bacterium]
MKKLLSLSRQAIKTYNMIDDGDVLAVGVSGGKDSLAMLTILNSLKSFYPKKFDIKAISIDLGFEDASFLPISEFCTNLGIEYTIEKTQIKEIVFDRLNEKSPCSLCSKMRRAALCESAKKLNCNKLALGHNKDDAIETFVMNTLYNGKAMCFEPVTHYEDMGISIIRPLIFTDEYIIKKFAEENRLPIMKKICPADGNTKREETKNMLISINMKNRNYSKNIFTAIKNLPEFKKYEVETGNENDGRSH